MKLYLDIDGVLLKDSLDESGKPAEYAEEFLQFVIKNFDCFWLTTHCMNGENHATDLISSKFPNLDGLINQIQPTNWSSWKTEAIDFSSDFRWIDDDVYKPEEDSLASHNATDKLIRVNLRENPSQLKNITLLLSNFVNDSSID